jgi:hypothetical protein
MFDTLLIANRGDQPALAGAAAQPDCLARMARGAGDFTAGAHLV